MSRVTLDTSGYSAFKRGQAGVVAHLRRAEEILLPAIALGELARRAESSFSNGVR